MRPMDFSGLNRYLKRKGLPPFNHPGKRIIWKDPITGESTAYEIGREWFLPRSDIKYSKMFFVIQTFQTEHSGERIRIGYYICGKKRSVRKRWMWGQYCPWYKPRDLANILPLLKKLAP